MSTLPTLRDLENIEGQRVLVRVDFNVPLVEGEIPEGAVWRLRAVLPTLQYLAQKSCRIILVSHLGRPNGQKNLRYSLWPVFLRLSEFWPEGNLIFGQDIFGSGVKRQLKSLKTGQAMLLENLRFYGQEEANDKNFAKDLSRLADIFVNDAFAAAHRAHASTVAVTRFIKSVAGFLMEKELTVLGAVREKARRPLVLIMGGAKAETKLKLAVEFIDRSEAIILGGVLANTLLYLKGLAVGRSLIDTGLSDEAKSLRLTNIKLHLPVDVLVSKSLTRPSDLGVKAVGQVAGDEFMVDIGPDSQRLFQKITRTARMIIWNGTLGLTEVPAFKSGTLVVAQAVAASQADKIIGGGDLTNFLAGENLLDDMTYVSTGGGAMLEFLAGVKLPAVEALESSVI